MLNQLSHLRAPQIRVCKSSTVWLLLIYSLFYVTIHVTGLLQQFVFNWSSASVDAGFFSPLEAKMWLQNIHRYNKMWKQHFLIQNNGKETIIDCLFIPGTMLSICLISSWGDRLGNTIHGCQNSSQHCRGCKTVYPFQNFLN